MLQRILRSGINAKILAQTSYGMWNMRPYVHIWHSFVSINSTLDGPKMAQISVKIAIFCTNIFCFPSDFLTYSSLKCKMGKMAPSMAVMAVLQ